jgi:glutamate dehydrogenase/leucine dehydrogenase
MRVLDAMTREGFEQVVFCHDAATGLRSIIAIHDTSLGPALGGVRMWPYSSEDDALEDCLRLAQGMTYKAAAADVDLGGGKSVIIGDPTREKTAALLRAHGRFIQTLGGRYIPGIDVGTEQDDLRVIADEAERVSCIGGDPSPMTALGVLEGIRACLRAQDGSGDLASVRVCVQGAGHVGSSLAEQLVQAGAEVVVADVDPARAKALADRLGGSVVPPDDAVAAECDVLAPCALGAIVDDDSLDRLRCRIIAGSANNVLAEPRHGDALHARRILYAPDYVVNAGGLVFLEEEIFGHDSETARERVRGVGDQVARVIEHARSEGISTARAAAFLAEERLRAARDVRSSVTRARRVPGAAAPR